MCVSRRKPSNDPEREREERTAPTDAVEISRTVYASGANPDILLLLLLLLGGNRRRRLDRHRMEAALLASQVATDCDSCPPTSLSR